MRGRLGVFGDIRADAVRLCICNPARAKGDRQENSGRNCRNSSGNLEGKTARPAGKPQRAGRGRQYSARGDQRNGEAAVVGSRARLNQRGRSIDRNGDGANVAHAGAATARQVFGGGCRAAAAARGYAQLELQVGQRRSATVHAGADLAFGDGITYANVHANDYRKLFDE